MTLDNDIKTSVNLRSDYSDSSINDSVFFNSSISIDVVCLIAVIVVLLLTIGLFLRLSKRIVLLESEISVEEVKSFFRWESMLKVYLTRRSDLPGHYRKFFNLKPSLLFSVHYQEEVSTLVCWLYLFKSCMVAVLCHMFSLPVEIWVESWLHTVTEGSISAT